VQRAIQMVIYEPPYTRPTRTVVWEAHSVSFWRSRLLDCSPCFLSVSDGAAILFDKFWIVCRFFCATWQCVWLL